MLRISNEFKSFSKNLSNFKTSANNRDYISRILKINSKEA